MSFQANNFSDIPKIMLITDFSPGSSIPPPHPRISSEALSQYSMILPITTSRVTLWELTTSVMLSVFRWICSKLTSLRSLVNVFWTKKEEVTEILKGAGSSSTRIMVHLRAFLFTAFDSGSKVLTKCTSLEGI